MAGPLAGLTVLDFSWGMPGAVAAVVLSDFGAEVIKVEPPGGDPFRPGPAWLAWNRGKKGIVLDLKTTEGRELSQALARGADVLIETFRPGVMQRLAMDYATLSCINPRLVYCSISGFGQAGPLGHIKGYDGIVAARVGRMLEIKGGPQRDGPVYTAVQIASWSSSQAAVRGILAALRLRERSGKGEWVQTSLLQGMFAYDHELMIHQLSRKDPEMFPIDTTAALRRAPTLTYLPVRTKDGHWIQMANLIHRLFQSFIRAIGLWHIYRDERFRDAPDLTPENREILRDMILDRMQEKTLDEWMRIFEEDGDVAAEPLMQTLEGMKHPQYVYNGHGIEIQDPRVGPMKMPNVLLTMSATPGQVQGPAPDLGQHTNEVLQRLRSTPLPPASAVGAGGAGESPRYPLDGVTILEFAGVVAAPLATALLADMGARVIKVEPPEGDPVRTLGGGRGNGAVRTTGGKESIMVDLRTDEGREVVHQLIARADALVHNYRPGVTERLGIDYETARSLNPNIVYHYAGAYGSTGPHSRRPAAHPIPGALMGGALRQAGRGVVPLPDTPLSRDELKEVSRRLFRGNTSNPDENTGMAIATGIMLGLYARERTGQGQYIESTMIQANAYANLNEAYDYAGRPAYRYPDEGVHGLDALYRLYKTKQGWVFLACPFQGEWEAFCRTVGRPELLEDPQFGTREARKSHDIELSESISQILASRTAAEWEQALTAADVACVMADAATMGAFLEDDPQMEENQFIVEADRPHLRFGRHKRVNHIVKLSGMESKYGTGCLGGEHTDSILKELGYDDAQIAGLRERSVVTSEPVRKLFD